MKVSSIALHGNIPIHSSYHQKEFSVKLSTKYPYLFNVVTTMKGNQIYSFIFIYS